MILGLPQHPPAECFRELDDALAALTTRTVCLNAHAFPDLIPEGAVVYQTENVPGQVPDPAWRFRGHEVWDLSARNAKHYGAHHVPVGWHPSMERFDRADVHDIDVVFSGCMNERRTAVLQGLADRGLNVVLISPGVYGSERNAILARAKLALNLLYYPDGIFPSLRVAHLVANHVPVLSERCPEGWGFVPTCEYEDLVDVAERIVRDRVAAEDNAAHSYERFRAMPMVLPC